MSDSEEDPLSSLLSSFALGPSWARATGDKPARKQDAPSDGGERAPRRDDRGPQRGAGPRDRDRDGGQRRPFQGRDDRRDERRDGPPRQEEPQPEAGVRATIAPDPKAVHLIGKEIHQVARVYPLFDVARILLAEKGRCRAIFETLESHAPLIRGKLDGSVFLTRAEAVRHLWSPVLREQFIEEETIEVDPPAGNFQAIARCGISGQWLGPVNFHSYQTNLRRMHRERFANMPFEVYASKVRTERGEEAVNSWLETMKKKTRWRIKGDGDDAWIDDRQEMERALGTRCVDQAFEEARTVDVSGAITPEQISPSLLASLRLAGGHARNHPAILIPAVCRAVEAEHLPVFKRNGKLHTGPARPHPLPPGAVLADRPDQMVTWIRENKPAKLEGLWKSVLPEGSTAPPGEYAADLFWLLQQGHILLFTDDTLVVQEIRDTATAATDETAPVKKKKKKKKKRPVSGVQGTPSEARDESEARDQSESSDQSDAAPDSDDVGANADDAAPADDTAEPEISETPSESAVEIEAVPETRFVEEPQATVSEEPRTAPEA